MSCRNRIRYIYKLLEDIKKLEKADLQYLQYLISEYEKSLILNSYLDNSNRAEERNDISKK